MECFRIFWGWCTRDQVSPVAKGRQVEEDLFAGLKALAEKWFGGQGANPSG
jgi:hypothetical protein